MEQQIERERNLPEIEICINNGKLQIALLLKIAKILARLLALQRMTTDVAEPESVLPFFTKVSQSNVEMAVTSLEFVADLGFFGWEEEL
jgi:hypothetical protein